MVVKHKLIPPLFKLDRVGFKNILYILDIHDLVSYQKWLILNVNSALSTNLYKPSLSLMATQVNRRGTIG
jgi:hypothetical protein